MVADEPRGTLSFPIPLERDLVVQLVIAEFNDRRAEINNRTTIQSVIISLNITAAGAVGGVGLSTDRPNRALLLLLAPICSALALIWANHAETIARIGAFIRYRIRRVIEAEDGRLWRCELDHDLFGQDRTRRILGFGLPVFLVFFGPPWFALGYAFKELLVNGEVSSRLWYLTAFGVTLYGAVVLLLTLGGPRFTSDLEPNWE